MEDGEDAKMNGKKWTKWKGLKAQNESIEIILFRLKMDTRIQFLVASEWKPWQSLNASNEMKINGCKAK